MGLKINNPDMQRPFTEAQIIFILHEVLQGLKYLHGIGIAHRDVKGSNILLNRQGQIKLADFGCSGVLSRKDTFGCTTFTGVR